MIGEHRVPMERGVIARSDTGTAEHSLPGAEHFGCQCAPFLYSAPSHLHAPDFCHGAGDRTPLCAVTRILDTLDIGMVLLDSEGAVLAGGAVARQILGVSEEEFWTGAWLAVPAHDVDGRAVPYAERPEVRAGRDGEVCQNTLGTVRDRQDVWLQVKAIPQRGADGAVAFVMATYEDVTASRQAEVELREREQRYRRLLDYSPVPIVVHGDGRLLYVNDAAARLAGVTSPDAVVGQPVETFLTPDDLPRFIRRQILLDHSEPEHVLPPLEWTLRRPDGEKLVVEILPMRITHQGHSAVLLALRDITEHRKVLDALRRSEQQFREIFERAAIGIELGTIDGYLMGANPAIRRLLGYTEEELRALSWEEITHPEDLAQERQLYDELLAGRRDHYKLEKRYIRKDGSPVWVNVTVSLMRDAEGKPWMDLALSEDITERRRQAEALRYQALHDDLTGLPNRVLFQDRLAQAIGAARVNGNSVALLLLDMDHFKELNDTLGHHYGDLLLQQLGPRLHGIVRSSDIIARLGGDEFAILLPAASATTAMEVAERTLEALEEPFDLDGHRFLGGVSIGIALFPHHGDSEAALLQHADIAMYSAKRRAAGYALYAEDKDDHTVDRLMMVPDLHQAIEDGQLLVYYQPIADVRTGQLRGMEALVRWQHPSRGFVLPGEFIGLAEQTGLIRPLLWFVLRQAVTECCRWSHWLPSAGVSVNLSSRNLQDHELVHVVRDTLNSAGLPPGRLTLEITESAIMADPEAALSTVTQLHNLGVRIAIDDFGTGYTSLAYLAHLPFSEVKIDRSFVRDLRTNHRHAAIVRSIVDLGRSLDLTTVAEGVEDVETEALLSTIGCTLLQGYHIGKPMPPDDVTILLRQQRPA